MGRRTLTYNTYGNEEETDTSWGGTRRRVSVDVCVTHTSWGGTPRRRRTAWPSTSFVSEKEMRRGYDTWYHAGKL